MKKIIDGKKYDTETAECVGSYSNDEQGFKYLYEELYIKKTGEFFLYGEGGAMTGYAESVPGNQGSYTGGSKIIPFSVNMAKEWAQVRLSVEDYEAIFGEVEE